MPWHTCWYANLEHSVFQKAIWLVLIILSKIVVCPSNKLLNKTYCFADVMKTIIIKYGGSFLIPDKGYSVEALEELKSLVDNFSDKQFVFIIGGGKLCRSVNEATSKLLDDALGDDEDQKRLARDELGIAVTKINGRCVLRWLTERLGSDIVYEDLVDYPQVAPQTDKRVIIATGYKPGVSTDYDMMLLAQAYGASSAFKISDFPVVLDANVHEFDKTKIDSYASLPQMTWKKMLELVGDTFLPGGNYPLDPPSALLGRQLSNTKPGFSLFIGQKEQLWNMLSGKEFIGTLVKG